MPNRMYQKASKQRTLSNPKIPEAVFFPDLASIATVHTNLENKSFNVIFRVVLVVGIKLKLVLDFSSRLFYPKGNSDFKPIYHASKKH